MATSSTLKTRENATKSGISFMWSMTYVNVTPHTMKTRVILVAGPPGSGKGTQCERLAESHNMIHASTGDIVRAEVKRDESALGKKAKAFLQNGDLLPDSLVFEIVEDVLNSDDARQRGVILDGFPRNANQAKSLLLSEHVHVERFILLDVNDDICVQRILNRYIDPETTKIYNSESMPAPSDEVKGRLIRREFDHDETVIRNRLAFYRSKLGGILPLFSGLIQVVNGAPKPTEVQVAIAYCMEGAVTSAVQVVRRTEGKQKKQKSHDETKKKKSTTAMKCTICLDVEADHLIVPCGHQCGCLGCLTQVKKSGNACPICRGNIDSLVQVFRAGADMDDDDDDDDNAPISEPEEGKQTEVDVVAVPTVKLETVAPAVNNGWGEDESSDDEKANDSTGVAVSVVPCTTMVPGEPVDLAIAVRIPDSTQRQPVDMVCVVDISGSMKSAAKFQDGDTVRDSGMSILDLVKHSVLVVSRILNEHDRLAVVAFDNASEICYELNYMTTTEQKNVETQLADLRPRGGTSIWEGLLGGMEALRSATKSNDERNRRKFVMLLTDGKPLVSPPRGEVAELAAYKENHPDFAFQVNTFGFGYSLNSELMMNLAVEGRGTFSFIPDAKILGTCFVNSVANAICSYSQSTDLHIMLKNGTQFVREAKSLGHDTSDTEASWGRVINIGPLQVGETHEFIVRVIAPATLNEYVEVVAAVKLPDGSEVKTSTLATITEPTDMSIAALHRLSTVSDGLKAVDLANRNKGNKAITTMDTLVGRVSTAAAGNPQNILLNALTNDVSGRMLKAFQTSERWNRWGKHYVRALVRAHQLKQCTNFMDPGLQPYGGQLFRELKDSGGKIFVQVRPPASTKNQGGGNKNPKKKKKHSRNNSRSNSPSNRSAPNTPPSAPTPAPAVNMNTYYEGGGGGCFRGDATVNVLIENSGERLINAICMRELRSGQQVQVETGEFVEVQHVISMPRSKHMVQLDASGLCLTPGHPIRVNGVWCKPRHIKDSTHVPSDGTVFNLVLPPGHVLLANNVPCVTWGHGLDDRTLNNLNPAKNKYYGSMRVLQNMRAAEGVIIR